MRIVCLLFFLFICTNCQIGQLTGNKQYEGTTSIEKYYNELAGQTNTKNTCETVNCTQHECPNVSFRTSETAPRKKYRCNTEPELFHVPVGASRSSSTSACKSSAEVYTDLKQAINYADKKQRKGTVAWRYIYRKSTAKYFKQVDHGERDNPFASLYIVCILAILFF